VRICPFDCAMCRDPTCRIDGCKETGEVVFEVCHCCGELFIPGDVLAVCTTCIERHGGGDETI
jgi:hypothetical protein